MTEVCLDRFRPPGAREESPPVAHCAACGEPIWRGETVYVVDGTIIHDTTECLEIATFAERMTVEEALEDQAPEWNLKQDQMLERWQEEKPTVPAVGEERKHPKLPRLQYTTCWGTGQSEGGESMELITYQNSSHELTLEDAVELHERGIAIAVNDGRHVTFVLDLYHENREEED